MKRALTRLAALSLLFGLAASPQPALGQADPSAQIDAHLTRLVKTEGFSGQVLVTQDGKVIFEKAYGMANRDHNVPTTMDTRYPISEMSMGVTAAAILMLQDQGKLSVSDPICKYFEECSKKWESVTLKRLLNSTAGIINPLSQGQIAKELNKRHTPNQLIDAFKKLPLLAEPDNQRFIYSPASYMLLAKVIEKVSGVTYAQFVKDNIFDKLGMSNTGVDDTTRVLQNRAEGYITANTKGAFADASNYYGFGSLYSTAGDLLKFQQALVSGKLISPAATKEMLSPSTAPFNANSPFRFGYAWELGKEAGGLNYALLQNFETIGEIGMPPRGFGGSIEYFPDLNVALILLNNSNHNYTALLQPALPWLQSIE
jgi:CubicO group peptidase (beta-lactamase class C family)